MSKSDKQNFSEEIFPSESCKYNLRSSQRHSLQLLQKNDNISKNFVFPTAQCTEDLFNETEEPLSKSAKIEIKLPSSQRAYHNTETEAEKEVDGIITPDFTFMFNPTYVVASPSSQVQISQRACDNTENEAEQKVDGTITPDLTFMLNPGTVVASPSSQLQIVQKTVKSEEFPLDLRLNPKRTNDDIKQTKNCRRKKVGVCKRRAKNSNKVSENIDTGNNMSEDILNRVVRSMEVQRTLSAEKPKLQQKTESQPCATTYEKSAETLLAEVPDCNKMLEPVISYKIFRNDDDEKTEKQRSSAPNGNGQMNLNNFKQEKNTAKPKKRGRPQLVKKGEKQNLDQNSPFTGKSITVNDYVAPKIEHYYNLRPTTKPPVKSCTYGLVSSNPSLLPTVYPAHFSQQIVMAPVTMPITTNYLTPESSQILSELSCLSSYEVKEPSSNISPFSVSSLQEYFEFEEICEILKTDKILYQLTELHVRALAHTLNLNVNNLTTVIDRIVEMDVPFLQKQCEIYESKTAKFISENAVHNHH